MKGRAARQSVAPTESYNSIPKGNLEDYYLKSWIMELQSPSGCFPQGAYVTRLFTGASHSI